MSGGNVSALADLVAALAVVLLLGFVAYEIRQSNKHARLANWRWLQGSPVAFQELTNDFAESELVHRGHSHQAALTPHERQTNAMYLEQSIHVIGNFTWHSDVTPPGYEGLQSLFRDLLATRGARQWWAETRGQTRFMQATQVMIDAVQADAASRSSI